MKCTVYGPLSLERAQNQRLFVFGVLYRSGVPRSMKMGTIRRAGMSVNYQRADARKGGQQPCTL
jgi:hypothetical protein